MKVMVMYNNVSRSSRNRIINLCLDYGLERIQKSVYLGDLEGKLKTRLMFELREFFRKEMERGMKVFEFPETGERKIL